MKDIIIRTISGAVFITLIMGSIAWNIYSSITCFAIVIYLGLHEFYSFFDKTSQVAIDKRGSALIGTAVFLMLSASFLPISLTPLFFISISFFLLFSGMIIELWRKSDQPLLNLSVQFFGYMYLLVPFIAMLILRYTSGMEVLIYMFLLIWTNDTFAYLCGRFLGKTKLFERISPKKTWEGTAGGILFSMIGAILIAGFTDGLYLFWITAAFIISVAAIFGDLLESLFKRSVQVKDSGNLIPGHGGILDRFDAALMAAPFFLCWVFIYDYFCSYFITGL